jgi:hypothetical protein
MEVIKLIPVISVLTEGCVVTTTHATHMVRDSIAVIDHVLIRDLFTLAVFAHVQLHWEVNIIVNLLAHA